MWSSVGKMICGLLPISHGSGFVHGIYADFSELMWYRFIDVKMLHIAPLHVRGPQYGVTDKGWKPLSCPSEYKTGGLREGDAWVVRARCLQDVCVFHCDWRNPLFQRKKIIHLKQAVKGHRSNL